MSDGFYEFKKGRDIGENYYHPLEKSAALTEKQRQFLLNMEGIEEKSAEERALRARLRDRLSRSIIDFALMHQAMESRDLEGAFEEHLFKIVSKSDSRGIQNTREVQFGSTGIDALAIMYESLTKLAASSEELGFVDNITDEQVSPLIEAWTELALQEVYFKENEGVKNINISIDLSFEPSIDQLLKREPDNISIPQYERLLQAGEITQDQFYQFVSVISGKNPHTEEPAMPLDSDL